MAELQARMREIASDHDSAVVVESTRAFFIRRYGNVDAFLKPPERAAGILTPWKQYNELTDGGIKRQELTIAAARPSMGKTAWAMNVAVYAAVKLGMKVLFFSAEQSKEQIFDRAVCSIARVTMRELRDTQARFTQTSYVNDAIQDLVSSFLWFDDTGDLTVDQIDARAELKSRTDGLDLMVTDFLQYLDPGRFARKNDTRSIQIGNMTKSLRNTGKRLHVGNLVLAQTGRKDSSSAPSLSDLRESGDIEQNADQVTFLHRPEYYDKVDPDKKGVAEFIIAKQRNGPTDTARTQFMGKYFSFVDQQ
jgi:replicative DNA helicase